MHLTIALTIFCSLLTLVEHKIYLTHSQDGTNIEYYDCIVVDRLTYCRRPDSPINLTRILQRSSCETNGGITHTFADLLIKNINTTLILHQWKSSIEQVEQYSRYLSNYSHRIDGFLCECHQPQSFGKFCEYELPAGDTLQQTLDWRIKLRNSSPVRVQIYGNITCYRGIECDSGLLCLDWREICDGVQNCMFGLDEEQCDLLELNVCGDDEYQCANGMCVPAEYFLDGELDCLDWSDEINIKDSAECGFEGVSSECDDHMCLSKEWSCGDGQCILDRFAFQKRSGLKTCFNRRDRYFWCETSIFTLAWTMPSGRCSGNRAYTVETKMNGTEAERCEYLLKCALSGSGETGCPCRPESTGCYALLRNCSSPLTNYPQGALPAPYIRLLFDRMRESRLPQFLSIDGSVKCQGSLVNVTRQIPYADLSSLAHMVETLFCQQPITRIRDGMDDCLNGLDENLNHTCLQVRHHRFRCSSDQPTCLSVIALADGHKHCHNGYDELWHGTSRRLSQISCNTKTKDECSLLRQYVYESWSSAKQQDTSLKLRIPFRSYCDTFVDLGSAEDEHLVQCRQWWVCASDQWQCPTGHCIDLEWLNDGEWDCNHGSDEEQLFAALTTRVRRHISLNPSLSRSLVDGESCGGNFTSFVCLSPHLLHGPLHCLNLTQLGDGEIDCLGGIDEQHTLRHNFLCASTNTTISYYGHCMFGARCPQDRDDQQWCRWRNTSSECNTNRDFVCFDGRCIRGARCNRTFECALGEDEYMCDYDSMSSGTIIKYRRTKEDQRRAMQHDLRLPTIPNDSNITTLISDEVSTSPSTISTPTSISSLSLLTPYYCNRGVSVLSTNRSIVCFCPSQYYGNFCQYHADRLSILLHLNLSQSTYTPQSDVAIVIKLLVLFLVHDQVLDTHEFHVRPAAEFFTFIKKMVHFPYSRSSQARQHRMQRYFNRSHLISTQPHRIRIEAYEGYHSLSSPVLIGVWQYSIAFDHLPVFRLAKVLHLTRSRSHPDPCSSQPCPANALCQPLINDPTRHICLCKGHYIAPDCSIEDQQCAQGYCAPHSLCKPNYRQLLRGNEIPYCICPFSRFGDRCGIVHDYCGLQPCLNNGSCFPTSSPNNVTCICTDGYRGSHCQFRRPHIRLSLIDDRQQYAAALVQYFDLDFSSLDLTLVHQNVHRRLPPSIDYLHDQLTLPEIIVAKLYRSHEPSAVDLYLLAASVNATHVDGTSGSSKWNQCAHVHGISNVSSPIEYHRVCQDEKLLCFRDDVYVCICVENHSRVECFRYDDELDHCSLCTNGGRCVRGYREGTTDFLCICPPCHSGCRCQIISKSFALTLDQLLYPDLSSTKRERTIAILLVFLVTSCLVGIANNLCSFVTLKQPQCLHNGVGYYLLSLSLINQMMLVLLCARLIHIIMSLSTFASDTIINDLCCKVFAYGLTCLTRISFWIASLIAVERVYTTLHLTAQWFKKPHIARRSISGVISLVFLSAAYEPVFIKSFSANGDGTGITCVSIYPLNHQRRWLAIHQTVSIFNMLMPLLINVGCTSTIISVVMRTKMNLQKKKTTSEFSVAQYLIVGWTCFLVVANDYRAGPRHRVLRNVLTGNMEMIARPAITLIPSSFSLFLLPLFILAFWLSCRDIDTHPVRYLVLVFYFATFVPSMITFMLYIYPSSFYWKEWHNTKLAQRIALLTNRSASREARPTTGETMTIRHQTNT